MTNLSAGNGGRAKRLEDLLSWRLAVAGRLVRARADAHPGFAELGAQAAGILMRLAEEDGLTQVALARRQRVEPPTLCRMVDRLERAGAVERRPHPGDRRAVRVFLTEAGRRAARRGWAEVGALEEAVFARLDPTERSQLAALLGRVLGGDGGAAGA